MVDEDQQAETNDGLAPLKRHTVEIIDAGPLWRAGRIEASPDIAGSRMDEPGRYDRNFRSRDVRGLPAFRDTVGHTSDMFKRVGVVALVVATMATACSGSDEAGESFTAVADAATKTQIMPTQPSDSAPPNLEDFCMAYEGLQGERPESYVGSPEHLADIEGLLTVAPDPVSADVSIFRDYLSSGVIDSALDPESNQTENWPAEVQGAIASVQAFGDSNC